MKATKILILLALSGRVYGSGALDHGEVLTGYDPRFVKEAGRIYTAPDPAATGGIAGVIPAGELTHAVAVNSERVQVYRALPGSNQFRFENLPVGKYDLILVTKDRRVYEGLRLGADIAELPPASRLNLETRIAKADAYFNRHLIHRCGIVNERILAFVERIRDRQILTQGGDVVNANIRQMTETRHVYRQYEPPETSPPFLRHVYVPALSGIRVVTTLKELGTLLLPKD